MYVTIVQVYVEKSLQIQLSLMIGGLFCCLHLEDLVSNPGCCIMQTIVESSNESSLAAIADISLQHTHSMVVATLNNG